MLFECIIGVCFITCLSTTLSHRPPKSYYHIWPFFLSILVAVDVRLCTSLSLQFCSLSSFSSSSPLSVIPFNAPFYLSLLFLLSFLFHLLINLHFCSLNEAIAQCHSKQIKKKKNAYSLSSSSCLLFFSLPFSSSPSPPSCSSE